MKIAKQTIWTLTVAFDACDIGRQDLERLLSPTPLQHAQMFAWREFRQVADHGVQPINTQARNALLPYAFGRAQA
jgi:hypothetical protein